MREKRKRSWILSLMVLTGVSGFIAPAQAADSCSRKYAQASEVRACRSAVQEIVSYLIQQSGAQLEQGLDPKRVPRGKKAEGACQNQCAQHYPAAPELTEQDDARLSQLPEAQYAQALQELEEELLRSETLYAVCEESCVQALERKAFDATVDEYYRQNPGCDREPGPDGLLFCAY